MKLSTVLLATCLIAFTAAQWPCHDFGWNGAISNCASCTVGGNTGGNAWLSTQSSTYSVCTNCTSGFYLNQSACIPCTANCTACYSNGACMSGSCAYGYTFVPTNSTCVACPSSLNCAKCTYSATTSGNSYGYFRNTPFACTACQNNGYYISATGACVACPSGSNCLNAATTNSWSAPGACPNAVCTSCASGYVAVTTSGSTVCTACGANCATCATAGSCDGGSAACATTATVGYYLNSNTCTACTPTNCIACTGGAATCTTCANGYWNNANVCTACPTGCTACTSATVCSSCTTGYYIAAATSVCVTATAANAANCSTLVNYNGATPTAATGYCTACVSGSNSTLSTTGTCIACNSNCTSCALTSSTATTTVCLQCQLGFGLNDTTGACVPCPPNCDYCDGSGVCTQCRQGAWGSFFPVVSGAQSGSNAPMIGSLYIGQGFYLPPNQCQQCPYNCSACANSTFCFNNCTKNYAYNSTLNLCLPNGASRIMVAGFAFLGALFYFI